MRTPIFLLSLSAHTITNGQNDAAYWQQQMTQRGVQMEPDTDPFVPNAFIGSFTMEMHFYKNGVEDKSSPMDMQYGSSEDMVMMKSSGAATKGQDMRLMTDLKGKWQYTLMTDAEGGKMAMKSRKMKVAVDGTDKAVPVITRTTETKVIDGHTCIKVIAKSDDGTWTGWVAGDLTAPFNDMARNVKKGNEQITRGMGDMQGFPLEFEWTSASGTDKTVVFVRDLRHGSVDQSTFSLDGYNVMELPSFGQ